MKNTLMDAVGRERTPAAPGPGRDHRARASACSSCRSAGGSTACWRATSARRSPGSAASSSRCARTSRATTSAGSSGTSPPAPGRRTSASSSPSACSSRGSCSTRRRRWRSAPPTGGRPTSPRASRSRSATRPRGAGTGSGSSRSGPEEPRFRRPRQGRRGLLLTLDALREAPAGKGDLGEALKLVDGLAVQRSLVVVVSDFRGPRDWRTAAAPRRRPAPDDRDRDPRPARAGARRRRRAAARRPRDRPPAPRRHEQREAARALRGRRRRGARSRSSQMLSSLGVPHVALSTEGDWLRPLAGFLKRSAAASMSFAAPLLLLAPARGAGRRRALRLVRAAARGAARPRGPRRRSCPNLVERPVAARPAPARDPVPDRAHAPARRVRAAGGDDQLRARGRDGRARDRHLGLDGDDGRQADAAARRAARRAHVPRRSCRRSTASRSRRSPTTRPCSSRRPTTATRSPPRCRSRPR